MSDLSSTTQLAILLTGRWVESGTKPLSNGEFSELRRWLGESEEAANALLSDARDEDGCPIEWDRLQSLIHRGAQIFPAAERWLEAGLWIAAPGDEGYPSRFEDLKNRRPALVFGFGNPNNFQGAGLAIVGSRNASEERLSLAAQVGRACAANEISVVSGGARGVDSFAMGSALEAHGNVIGVLADSLLKESGKAPYRDAIEEGNLCLMSEVHPEARFDVGNAMARNRLAYACANAALVVECEPDKGGTWAGALDGLRDGKPVYVLAGALAEAQLRKKGAVPIEAEFALNPRGLVDGLSPEGFEATVPVVAERRAKPTSLSLFDGV